MGAVFANGAGEAGLSGKHYFAYRPNFILMSTVLGCSLSAMTIRLAIRFSLTGCTICPSSGDRFGFLRKSQYNWSMEQKFTSASGKDLEQLASQLDRTLSLLANTEARLAGPMITPGETRFRDPQDVHHQITLGAVLCAYGLNAHHARAIDGLLSMTVVQLKAVLEEASSIEGDDDDDEEEDETMGAVLLKLVELVPGRLDEFGRYAEWRRGFDAYMDRTRPYLEGMTAEDLEKLETRPPSQNQMRQIRVTCAYHRIPFPAVANRRRAFEWLRDFGANTRYRELPR